MAPNDFFCVFNTMLRAYIARFVSRETKWAGIIGFIELFCLAKGGQTCNSLNLAGTPLWLAATTWCHAWLNAPQYCGRNGFERLSVLAYACAYEQKRA